MTIQEIKKEFFTFRNGFLADTLRKAGMPYAVIFGLNVPQLGDIARRVLGDSTVMRWPGNFGVIQKYVSPVYLPVGFSIQKL